MALSSECELLAAGSHLEAVLRPLAVHDRQQRYAQFDELPEDEELDEEVEGEVGGRAEVDGRVVTDGVDGQQCLQRSWKAPAGGSSVPYDTNLA